MFILAVASFLFYFGWKIGKPTSGSGKKVEVKIENGESTWEIGSKLEGKNLVSSDWVFYLYMKFKEKSILTGNYLIPNNLSIIEVAGILEKGEHQVKKITILEGWRREQIAVYLEEHAGISAEEFLMATKNYEGRLFPDTYDLTDEPTADEAVTKMVDDYNLRTLNFQLSEDDLILASIIEREAADDSERADIARVFVNRIKKGMKLEADPTVQYQKDSENYSEVGLKNYKFWQKLETSDLKKITGEYNTYLISGLPPKAICNPGVKSIEAALNPSTHNYLYFLHGKDGKIHFSATELEHNKQKALYL